MQSWLKFFLTAAALTASVSTFAGTIITDNLPADTAIINIDARADGASGYNGDQSLWYSPFNSSGSLLTYAVSAGTYTFRVIDPADAAQLFPALTSAQLNQIYTGWTFNSPWLEDYLVFDSAATNNNSIPQFFDGACTNVNDVGPWYPDAASAYNSVLANGSYNKIRLGFPNGRDGTTFVGGYTFTTATNLVFVIPDYGLGDNAGGVSVLVQKIGDLAVNWFKVANGGGVSSDGAMTIKGTAGQSDAGAMSDGTLSVHGGFWVSAIQTPGAPFLNIARLDATTVEVFWAATGNYTLQTNNNLASPNWPAYGGNISTLNGTNSATITPIGNLFFRLQSQ